MAYQFNTLMQVIFCEPIIDGLTEATIEMITLPANFFISSIAFKCTDVERGEFEINGNGTIGFNSPDYDNVGYVSYPTFIEVGQASGVLNFAGAVLPANTPLFLKVTNVAQGYIQIDFQLIIIGFYI